MKHDSPTNCVSLNLRKTTRGISQFYNEALKPSGLRGTQFSLLMVVSKHGQMSLGALADFIVMDRSTLSRNLRPLEKQGLLSVVPDPADARGRLVSLTPIGQVAIKTAEPMWQKAQQHMLDGIGAERWSRIREDLSDILKSV